MIKPIYQVCSVCNGNGKVLATLNPRSSTDATRGHMIPCEACSGTGAMLSRYFIVEGEFGTESLADQLENMNEIQKYVILYSKT